MADIARLTTLIEPEAAALGFELVRVAMVPSEAGDGGMALQIMAEDPATGQLVLDQCAALSRRISDVIDAAGNETILARDLCVDLDPATAPPWGEMPADEF